MVRVGSWLLGILFVGATAVGVVLLLEPRFELDAKAPARPSPSKRQSTSPADEFTPSVTSIVTLPYVGQDQGTPAREAIGEASDAVPASLTPTFVTTLELVDQSGLVLIGERVRILDRSLSTASRLRQADEQGKIVLARGGPRRIDITPPDESEPSFRSTQVLVEDARVDSLRVILLPPPVLLAGIVTDALGTGVAGAIVSCRLARGRRAGRCDQWGRFQLFASCLPEFEMLEVEAMGPGSDERVSQVVRLPAGSTSVALTLPPTGTIVGSFANPNHLPRVSIKIWHATNGWVASGWERGRELAVSGDFKLSRVPSGTVDLHVEPVDGEVMVVGGVIVESGLVTRDSRLENLVVTTALPPLQIEVVDEHEKPVAGAFVYLDVERGSGVDKVSHEAETDHLGRASFPGISKGHHSVTVEAIGRRLSTVKLDIPSFPLRVTLPSRR